jgi:imidazolonepropionase-like amidohydrolase
MLAPKPSRLAVLTAILCAASLHGEIKVLKDFTLIDGTGHEPVPAAAMILDNGRIRWVGPAAQLQTPPGAQVISLAGKYVMPGIINLHGHLGNTVDLTQDAKFFTRENVEKNLRTYAAYGVTSVLSLGTDQDLIFQIRAAQRAGRLDMTRVFTAGQGFIFEGGYGGIAGVNQGVTAPAEVAPAAAAQVRKGVDVLKLWMDDHLGEFPKMPYPIAKAVIDAGHEHHVPVVAHVFYLEDAKEVTRDGVNALAHMVRDRPVDQELIAEMKRQGTWQMAATLSREASLFIYAKTPPFAGDPTFARGVSPAVLQTLRSPAYQKTISSDPHFSRYQGFFETAKKNLKLLADAGIRYGFGTDTGPPGRFPGYFEQWEMELMVEAGLTPMQVLTTATRNAAEFLQAKDLGTLEASKWADLIVLDRNPLADIHNVHSIAAVYIAGNPIKR